MLESGYIQPGIHIKDNTWTSFTKPLLCITHYNL